jgi:hypothetical protein
MGDRYHVTGHEQAEAESKAPAEEERSKRQPTNLFEGERSQNWKWDFKTTTQSEFVD